MRANQAIFDTFTSQGPLYTLSCSLCISLIVNMFKDCFKIQKNWNSQVAVFNFILLRLQNQVLGNIFIQQQKVLFFLPKPTQLLICINFYILLFQIRLTNGSALTSSFSPDTTLFTVHEYIADKRTDGDAPFTISTTFPRKIFGDADMLKSLKDLGLMPSAVLVVGRK